MVSISDLLTYGRVTDTFFAGVADADNDPFHLPDITDVTGTATFTPNLGPGEVLLFASVPAVYLPMPKVATYDLSGALTINGNEIVVLEATDNPYASRRGWTWTVTFSGLSVNGAAVTRNGFSFPLPASSAAVDLTQLMPVTQSNGTPVTQGPPGTPGAGILLRGSFIGNNSSVLPAGYTATQNGYTYRVHSGDYSYDELWTWVWAGSSGTWADLGRWTSYPIDDSGTSATTTWSSLRISSATAAGSGGGGGGGGSTGGGNIYQVRQDPISGAWPLRSTATTSTTDVVEWVGVDFPPVGNGYALVGVDTFEGISG